MLKSKLNSCCAKYDQFINSCYVKGQGFRLTPNSEVSPYALCFAIFGKHLIGRLGSIEGIEPSADVLLRDNLNKFKADRLKCGANISTDKAYLQLLCFTLSALSVIGTLRDDPLEKHVFDLLDQNIPSLFEESGVFLGKPGTGNLAMFYAILLIHSGKYLGKNETARLNWWVSEHLATQNEFGFWGDGPFKYIHFQNGYHQYEIFDYLGINKLDRREMVKHISSVSDRLGHFAPYPGGGACYDYDALYLLTGDRDVLDKKHLDLLGGSMLTLLSEQNQDGGFCESHCVRPLNTKNIVALLTHAFFFSGNGQAERLRYCLTLFRSKHNRINTHWTEYSREWSESNLWDSWFRVLAMARIDYLLNEDARDEWHFIDYPGIGYHCN